MSPTAAALEVVEAGRGMEGDEGTIPAPHPLHPPEPKAASVITVQPQRTTPRRLPSVVDASEFLAQELTTPPELIGGVLHRGCKLVLGGASKSYKTWVLLDMAVAVSQGVPWLGFATTKGRVLFANLELPDWHFQERIKQLAKAKGVEIAKGTLDVWNLRGYATGFRELLPRCQEVLGPDRGYGLLILDPIYKLLGDADENKAGDIAKLLNDIDSVAVGSGAAVAFAAHFSKGKQGQKQAMDRMSGSGVFARDPDAILTLTPHEVSGAYVLESTLRNFPPLDPRPMFWNHPLMEPNGDLDPSRVLGAKGGRKEQFPPGLLLEALKDGPLARKELFDAVAGKTGMSERTFAIKLKSLRDERLVVEDGDGRLQATSSCNNAETANCSILPHPCNVQ